jgi:hypothetical protein
MEAKIREFPKIRPTVIKAKNDPIYLADLTLILKSKELSAVDKNKANQMHNLYMLERKNSIRKAWFRQHWKEFVMEKYNQLKTKRV